MEMEDGQTFVGQRNFAGRKWIAGIDQRYPLEVDVSARELRHDEIHVVRQAAQDRTGDLLRAIATLIGVALELLDPFQVDDRRRSEEHTSELQSLMRISYAVFCLKKKT